jgi:hypothetical protein
MPFKQGKSPADIARKINKALTEGLSDDLERGLFTMYTILAGTADFYVPVDTSTLVKSRAYRIRKMGKSWKMTYGYYTDYAAALHNNPNWLPRMPAEGGKKGGGYNPNAQYDWMNIAWNEVGDEAMLSMGKMIEPK